MQWRQLAAAFVSYPRRLHVQLWVQQHMHGVTAASARGSAWVVAAI